MDYEPAQLVFVDNTLNTRLKMIRRKHKKPTDKKEYHKEYYEKNKDKLLQFQNQYNSNTKEGKKQYNKEYYEKNKDKPQPKARIASRTNAEYSRQYYAKHKEKIRENAKKRYFEDKEKHEKQLERHRLRYITDQTTRNDEGKNRHQIYRERKRRERYEKMSEEEKKAFEAKKERYKIIEGETALERKKRFDRDYYDRNREIRLAKQNEKRRLRLKREKEEA